MQTEFRKIFFAGVLRVKAYLCCFTQFTVDQSKLTVNGSGTIQQTGNQHAQRACVCVCVGGGGTEIYQAKKCHTSESFPLSSPLLL